MTYNPLVQTFIARIAASYLTQSLNTVVKIDGLYITPRIDLNMKGVLVLDRKADTLFNAEDVFLDMKRFSYSQEQKIFAINNISVHGASFTLFKGRHDTVFSYDFIRDHFETHSPEIITDTIHSQPDWRVALNGLELDRVRFRYIDENKERKSQGMDYTNLDIFVQQLRMTDLTIHNDTFNFYISHLQAKEKCGFIVDTLQGNFMLSPLFLIADSLKVVTPRSDIDLDLAFHYRGWPAYLKFTEEVEMISYIRPSEINMKDIGYFAPELLVMNNQLRIGGKVKGKVNNLRVSDFRFAYGDNTRFNGDIRLYGLPDVVETYIHTRINEFKFALDDIKHFAIPGENTYVTIPKELEVFGEMSIHGKFTGFYNDFVSTATFESNIGTISTDVSLRQNKDHTDVIYEGKVKARHFHIGKFLRLDSYLGEMNLNAMVTGSGLTGSTVKINMNGSVDSLEFMGNTFNQLGISGDIADKKFNGHLDINDSKIALVFDGILDFDQPKPLFDFTADIQNADLYALNLVGRDSVSVLSAMLNCNFIGLDLDDLEGRIYIDSLDYTEGNQQWLMEQFALISLKDTGYYKRILLNADFIDARINGSFTYSELPYAINRIIESELHNWAFLTPRAVPVRRQTIDFEITLGDTRPITDIFVPGLVIEENSTIIGSFDSKRKDTQIDANFPSVSYAGIQTERVNLNLLSNRERIRLGLSANRILLKEKDVEDTLQLGLENFALKTTLNSDSLNFQFAWDDKDVIRHNKADVRGYFTYLDSIRSELRITHADVLINDSVWTVAENNQIILAKDHYTFKGLDFKGNKQKMAIMGSVSHNPLDTLLVDFVSWKLSNFDIIFRNYNFDLNGITNGHFGISDLYGSPNFFSDLKIRRLEMNDILIGDANLRSRWNDERKSIDVLSEIIYHGNVDDSRVLSLRGSYFPDQSNDNLDFLLQLENMHLSPFGRFAEDYISGLKGVSSGKLNIKGSTNAPLLTGQLKMMRTECRVNYLNTRYSFSHSIDFSNNAFSFNDLVIYDTLGNTATLNGRIMHENLSDFQFDLTLRPENFIILQTNRYRNETFYGTGIATGMVWFYGPANDFHIDANVSTSKGTNIVIPLNNTMTVVDNDFVIFLSEDQQDEDQLLQDYSVDLKGLNLDFTIKINNTAETMIYLPSNMGTISSKGYGEIRLTIDPRGQFEIYGDYNFLRGTFFFTFQNMINRRFEILQGGKISFAGNPYNADVDLRALYRLKTSLSGLGANISPELEGQRVNVNTILGLRGKLANPEIRFSIDFPNVTDDIERTIYAILDTNDVALMNQQMISLLLMNSFSYASTSTSMGASSLNIISSQLSNWLSQISNDFDVGINYRSGDELTQDELEVALSTQFFDNRLTVDGNVGLITRNNTQQNASNLVGDVNIEYKLRPDGRLRLRAFNRSNNFNSLEFSSRYTQGVGVFFIRDFDRFEDIFRRQKKSTEK
ncbi:MAG: translocation/assembly module TamB domain-containing protein [Bacteroidales bacterium]|nr:translocation/assembly module TamB domain-containing protein [Bacteroidales bacterium]